MRVYGEGFLSIWVAWIYVIHFPRRCGEESKTRDAVMTDRHGFYEMHGEARATEYVGTEAYWSVNTTNLPFLATSNTRFSFPVPLPSFSNCKSTPQ